MLTTPAGFAEMDDTHDDYGYQATSAEGVVIAVRKEDNDPQGNLDFWAKALDYELQSRGYETKHQTSVQTEDGVTGRQLRYSITRQGRPHVLLVSVFVNDDDVYVVEAGGDEEYFAQVKTAVANAVKTLDAS